MHPDNEQNRLLQRSEMPDETLGGGLNRPRNPNQGKAKRVYFSYLCPAALIRPLCHDKKYPPCCRKRVSMDPQTTFIVCQKLTDLYSPVIVKMPTNKPTLRFAKNEISSRPLRAFSIFLDFTDAQIPMASTNT